MEQQSGGGTWTRKRRGSYELLPPDLSDDTGDKLKNLKEKLYRNMNLEDFSQKFGQLTAEMDRKMDQHVMKGRLRELGSELDIRIKRQEQLKTGIDCVMTNIEVFKEELKTFKDDLKRQMEKLLEEKEKLKVSLQNNRRTAMISLFSMIFSAILFMVYFIEGSVLSSETSVGITALIVCAGVFVLGYILGQTRRD